MTLGHTYRLRTIGSLRGSTVEFGVNLEHVGPGGTIADMANTWVTSMMPLVLNATSAEVNWSEIMISDRLATGDETVHFPLTQPNPGLVVGDCLPGQNAMVVSLTTGQKGRRMHGRLYLPGVSETTSANGQVTGAQLTAIQALGAGLVEHYGPGGTYPTYRLVIYSPPTPPFKPKPAPPVHTDTLITPVTAYKADHIIRTQRRRAIGVGR
jgi:hypothetical protein